MYKQNKRRRSDRCQSSGGDESTLSNFLGIYDMLMAVTEELHYADIMNLSRVSKSMRESVLPAHDFDRRLEAFKRYTCPGANKTHCWLCDKQICTVSIPTLPWSCDHLLLSNIAYIVFKDCQQVPLIPQATLSHHLHNCRPFCTQCYRTSFVSCRPAPSQRLRKPCCNCGPITAHPNFVMRWIHGSNHYDSKQSSVPKFPRAVCRDCNLHSAQELLEMREKKTKLELKGGKGLMGRGGRGVQRLGAGRT